MPTVNTNNVKDRRSIRYASLDELLSDMDRLVAAEKSGTLKSLGNWTLGQAFNHLATWFNFGWDGYPMRVPWFIRLFLRMKKKRYLTHGMDSGIRIPGTANGTYGTEVVPTDVGYEKLKRCIIRMKNNEVAKFHSPAFGPMSHEERTAFNLRHAELHLSFFVF